MFDVRRYAKRSRISTTMARLTLLVLLSAIPACQSFLVAPPVLAADRDSCTRPSRVCKPVPRRGRQTGPHQASPKPSPESIDEARQRLIESRQYGQLVDRAENPFAEAGKGVPAGDVEDGVVVQFLTSLLRFTVDVIIVLLPLVLLASSGMLPPQVTEAFGSVSATIRGTPAIEQVLETLPWEPTIVLKWAAEGFLAILLSPLADRLVVTPAINQWVQARLRSLNSGK